MPDLDFVPMPRTAPTPTAVAVPAERATRLVALTAPGDPEAPGASAGRAAGFAAGYSAGYTAGARRAATQAAAEAALTAGRVASAEAARAVQHTVAVSALTAAAQAAQRREEPVLADCLDAVHAAAVELAVALLGVELSDAGRSAQAAIGRALAARTPAGPVVVHLHPRDAAAVAGTDLGEDVRVVADPTLAPGDAVAEHADGRVDARIAAAVERARAALGDL